MIARCLDLADKVIVEADGADGRPIKAPEDWEPVIPTFANLVIPVVGLDCVGKPASEDWVFRIERFLALTGLRGRNNKAGFDCQTTQQQLRRGRKGSARMRE